MRLTGADEGTTRKKALEDRLTRYSLKEEASRRRRLRSRNSELETITPHMAFADSRIVKGGCGGFPTQVCCSSCL